MNTYSWTLVAIGACGVGFLLGHKIATRQMIDLYGEVLSAETILYLAETDALGD